MSVTLSAGESFETSWRAIRSRSGAAATSGHFCQGCQAAAPPWSLAQRHYKQASLTAIRHLCIPQVCIGVAASEDIRLSHMPGSRVCFRRHSCCVPASTARVCSSRNESTSRAGAESLVEVGGFTCLPIRNEGLRRDGDRGRGVGCLCVAVPTSARYALKSLIVTRGACVATSSAANQR